MIIFEERGAGPSVKMSARMHTRSQRALPRGLRQWPCRACLQQSQHRTSTARTMLQPVQKGMQPSSGAASGGAQEDTGNKNEKMGARNRVCTYIIKKKNKENKYTKHVLFGWSFVQAECTRSKQKQGWGCMPGAGREGEKDCAACARMGMHGSHMQVQG